MRIKGAISSIDDRYSLSLQRANTIKAAIMNRVRLYYLNYHGAEDDSIHQGKLKLWLSELSQIKQARILRLARPADRIMSLLATQMLKVCARDAGIENFRLSDVDYPENGKPYWNKQADEHLDFNITHSANLLVVAVSRTLKVGIDAERVRQLRSLNFKRVFCPEELAEIRIMPGLFFDYWTKKEAVVKAANTSGIGRMHDVRLKQNYALLEGKKWYLKNIKLNELSASEYVINLATSEPVDEIIIMQIMPADMV